MDKTASGADEIGESLQRVASAAENSNISLEKTASWIATISSITREGASTIGRSLSSAIARYEQIRAKGFNEEDATKINDVVKALKAVGIQGVDSTGQLRDFADVMDELGAKFKTLEKNEQSYVVTAMFGTYQRNRGLTLLENYDQALKNYSLALNSAGAAEQKFGIYLESPQAKLDEFKATVDGLWQNTLNSKNLKTVIDFGVGLVKLADNIGLVNIALVVLGGIVGAKLLMQIPALSTAFQSLAVSMGLSQAAAGGLLGIAAALVTAIGVGLVSAINSSTKKFDEQKEKVAKLGSEIEILTAKIEQLKGVDSVTDKEQSYLKYLERQLELKKELYKVEAKRALEQEFGTELGWLQSEEAKDSYSKGNGDFFGEIARQGNILVNKLNRLFQGESYDAPSFETDKLFDKYGMADTKYEVTLKNIEKLNTLLTQYKNVSDEVSARGMPFDFKSFDAEILTAFNPLQKVLDSIKEYEVVLGDDLPPELVALRDKIQGIIDKMIKYGIVADENSKKPPVPKQGEPEPQYTPPHDDAELAKSVKLHADAMKTLGDFYDILNDKKKTDADATQFLIENYDSLVAAGVDVENMLKNVGNAETLVTDAIQGQAIARGLAFAQMTDFQKTYMGVTGKQWQALYVALAGMYGADLKNFKSLGATKAEIDKALIKYLGQSWAKYYGSQAKAIKAAMNSIGVQIDSATDEKTRNALIQQYEDMEAMYNTLTAMSDIIDDITLPTFDKSGGGGGSSSKISAYLKGILDKLDARAKKIDAAIDREKKELDLIKDRFEQEKKINDLLKAREELANAQNERNTRMLINGEWQWVADPRAVREAQERVDELERQKKEDDAIKAQQAIIDNLEKQKDIYTNLKEAINNLSDSAKKSIKSWDALIAALKKAGLLPSNLPKLDVGGEVKDSGAAVIHRGEGVLKADQNKNFKEFVNGLSNTSSPLNRLMNLVKLPTASSFIKNNNTSNSGGNVIIQNLTVQSNNAQSFVKDLQLLVPLANRVGK